MEKVDRVMTQVDKITEDIAHMPVAAFIFRDKEIDEVQYSTVIRQVVFKDYLSIVNLHSRSIPSPFRVKFLKEL